MASSRRFAVAVVITRSMKMLYLDTSVIFMPLMQHRPAEVLLRRARNEMHTRNLPCCQQSRPSSLLSERELPWECPDGQPTAFPRKEPSHQRHSPGHLLSAICAMHSPGYFGADHRTRRGYGTCFTTACRTTSRESLQTPEDGCGDLL